MNLNQISSASVAVMVVLGALRSRRPDYANAAMERPDEGVRSDFVRGAVGDGDRLADLAILLDLVDDLANEIQAEPKPTARARLTRALEGLQAVMKDDPKDVLGRIRFGRYGQWFPMPRKTTKAAILIRAFEAMERGDVPACVMQAVAERAETPSTRSGLPSRRRNGNRKRVRLAPLASVQ